jgi:hypothetical protein
MNPANPSRMRQKLRLALRLSRRDRGVNLNAVVMEVVGNLRLTRACMRQPRSISAAGEVDQPARSTCTECCSAPGPGAMPNPSFPHRQVGPEPPRLRSCSQAPHLLDLSAVDKGGDGGGHAVVGAAPGHEVQLAGLACRPALHEVLHQRGGGRGGERPGEELRLGDRIRPRPSQVPPSACPPARRQPQPGSPTGCSYLHQRPPSRRS